MNKSDQIKSEKKLGNPPIEHISPNYQLYLNIFN